jgi:pimeloyl-ACP methyl ester carboxylesterase
MRADAETPSLYVTRILIGIFVLTFVLVGCLAGQEPEVSSGDDPSRWAREAADERFPMLEICRPEGAEEDMLCGTLKVWEDREAQSGRKIGLNVAVIPAHTEDRAPDPFTFIAGGPGEGIAGAAGYVPRFAADILTRRDVFLVDQRGTGKSNGLYCSWGITPEDPQPAYDAFFPLEPVKSCLADLETRADLTKYTTSIAADDLEEVRRWLGYGRINLEGGSYGTRLVQEFLRRHPQSVRTAMLSGVVSMDHRMPLNHALDGQRSLDLVLTLCEEDEACSGAFPRLRRELWELLERLDEAPDRFGRATLDNPLNPGHEITLTVGRGMFAESLRSLLYTVGGSTELPFIVHRAHLGDFAPFFRSTVEWRVFIEREIANGMYLSVTCGEDVARFTEWEAALHNAGTAVGGFRTDAQKAACAVWPTAEVPESFHRPVATDRPVLIAVGELDPVTPPRYGREAAKHMPNGLFVVVPGGHHAFDSLSNEECLDGIMARFLEQASDDGLDTSCVETMERPPFVLEEAGMSYMQRKDGEPMQPSLPEPPDEDGGR